MATATDGATEQRGTEHRTIARVAAARLASAATAAAARLAHVPSAAHAAASAAADVAASAAVGTTVQLGTEHRTIARVAAANLASAAAAAAARRAQAPDTVHVAASAAADVAASADACAAAPTAATDTDVDVGAAVHPLTVHAHALLAAGTTAKRVHSVLSLGEAAAATNGTSLKACAAQADAVRQTHIALGASRALAGTATAHGAGVSAPPHRSQCQGTPRGCHSRRLGYTGSRRSSTRRPPTGIRRWKFQADAWARCSVRVHS